MDSKLWKHFRNDLSFLVCSYMNNLVDSDNIMYTIVKEYDKLFPEDNIFYFLNPDDKLSAVIDSLDNNDEIDITNHPFECLPLIKMPYFSFKHRQWKWNYERRERQPYYNFVEDWIMIIQTKYNSGYKEMIVTLLKTYEKKKQVVLNKLNECVKETQDLQRVLLTI